MSFVLKHLLSSFPLFSIFCSSLHSRITANVCFPLRLCASWRLFATICPEQDHDYRLSQVTKVVKRKMRKCARGGRTVRDLCRRHINFADCSDGRPLTRPSADGRVRGCALQSPCRNSPAPQPSTEFPNLIGSARKLQFGIPCGETHRNLVALQSHSHGLERIWLARVLAVPCHLLDQF